MKELVVIYGSDAEASESVLEILDKLDIDGLTISKIDAHKDETIAAWYANRYNLVGYPVVLGFIDEQLIDAHYGPGSAMVFESLVN